MNRRGFLVSLLAVPLAPLVKDKLKLARHALNYRPHPAQVAFFGGTRGGGKSDYLYWTRQNYNLIVNNPRYVARIEGISNE